MIFHTYGIEGVHFERQGDNFVFLPDMTSPHGPGERRLVEYGWWVPPAPVFPAHSNLNEFYRPFIVELENSFIGRENYFYHIAPLMRFTEDDNRNLADLQVVLNQTRDTYVARFIAGHIDINCDATWQGYLDTMQRLGLDSVEQIRRAAFERAPQP
jgi:putative aldouronate transport system substrate-binding protein